LCAAAAGALGRNSGLGGDACAAIRAVVSSDEQPAMLAASTSINAGEMTFEGTGAPARCSS